MSINYVEPLMITAKYLRNEGVYIPDSIPDHAVIDSKYVRHDEITNVAVGYPIPVPICKGRLTVIYKNFIWNN